MRCRWRYAIPPQTTRIWRCAGLGGLLVTAAAQKQVVKLPSRQGGDVSAQRKLGRDGVGSRYRLAQPLALRAAAPMPGPGRCIPAWAATGGSSTRAYAIPPQLGLRPSVPSLAGGEFCYALFTAKQPLTRLCLACTQLWPTTGQTLPPWRGCCAGSRAAGAVSHPAAPRAPEPNRCRRGKQPALLPQRPPPTFAAASAPCRFSCSIRCSVFTACWR